MSDKSNPPPNTYFDYDSLASSTGEVVVRNADSGKFLYVVNPAEPPPEPPPSSVQELLAVCKDTREQILAVMRAGYEFHPWNLSNFIALGTGKIKGFLLPRLGCLFDAAIALDLGNAPTFPGEPQTGRDAIIDLDTLLAWCRAKQQPGDSKPAAKQPPAKSKRGGGRKPLEARNPFKANLYMLICKEHRQGKGAVDTVARLKQLRDVVTLAGKAGVTKIDKKLVRNALAWEWQRLYRDRQKLPDNETDGTPLYDSDD